jgi:hypothetical protein
VRSFKACGEAELSEACFSEVRAPIICGGLLTRMMSRGSTRFNRLRPGSTCFEHVAEACFLFCLAPIMASNYGFRSTSLRASSPRVPQRLAATHYEARAHRTCFLCHNESQQTVQPSRTPPRPH